MLDCIRAGIREIINCVASSVVWADETMVIRFANSSKASLIGLPSVLAVVCFLACEFLFFTLVGIESGTGFDVDGFGSVCVAG